MSAARARSRATSVRALIALGMLAAGVASVPAQSTGGIAGVVRSGTTPVANARVTLDSARETRSDSMGGFAFRDVAAGRHVLEVRSLGAAPVKTNVIVPAGETLEFEIQVEKIVTLDSVLVEGSTVRQEFARAYEDRKRVGLGRFMDSTEVKKFGAVHQALLFIPGVRAGVARGGGNKGRDSVWFTQMGGLCLPNVWVDMQNWGTDQGVLRTMRTDDIVAVEVYTRVTLIPDEFKARGHDRGCGALVIWTRRFWPQGKGKPK